MLPLLVAHGVAADVERAVALLVELPVAHRDDGAHRVAAAEVRDVAALDAARERGQAQPLLQVAQALLDVVALALLLGERVARVVVGHREQVDAVAALGEQQRHLVPGAIGEPLGDAVDALAARTGG